MHCSQRCRQAAHRFGGAAVARRRATDPHRFAYADPPYPKLARRYYKAHPDYAGEVDHAALLSRLQDFDGWALSTSARALPFVLSLCVARVLPVRVAAWFRGARPGRSAFPRSSWEPVIYLGGRLTIEESATIDSLEHVSRPRRTDPRRVVGTKPARVVFWIFDLLGALPGDSFTDIYPGSGGVSRAWDVYASRSSRCDASRGSDCDASRRASRDASPAGEHDASPPAPSDASRWTSPTRRVEQLATGAR